MQLKHLITTVKLQNPPSLAESSPFYGNKDTFLATHLVFTGKLCFSTHKITTSKHYIRIFALYGVRLGSGHCWHISCMRNFRETLNLLRYIA